MTIENGELTTKTVDDWTNNYLRFVRIRNPNAKTGPDEYYYIQARNLANMLLNSSNDARIIAGRISLQDMTGSDLDDAGKPTSQGGINCPRPGASGASGSVVVSATASGSRILAGDELTSESGVAYRCTTTARYYDGGTVPIECTETGPATNLDAGAKLTWSNPRPGCFASATVYEQADGTGLTGGRDALGDDEYREMLTEAMANPAASANPAALRKQIEDSAAHGVAVEKAFTYGAAIGPGITAFTFTLKGSATNGSRLPNATQINTVGAHLESNLLSTDGLVKVPLVDDALRLAFRIRWQSNGWEDVAPWPYWAAAASRVVVSAVANATSFTLATADASYSGVTAPSVGNVIGFFDASNGKVVRKTIASVSGSGPWAITCETLAGASDLVYVPVVGQWPMPWSDSLQSVLDIAIAYVNAMGPGEISATLPEDGQRVAREPSNAPGYWPSQMDSRLEGAISDLSAVKRVSHEDGSDFSTAVGGLTVLYLPRLAEFAVFAL